MGLTQDLCARIVAAGADTMDEKVFEAARPLVLDGIAVAIAGARSEAAIAIMADHFRQEGCVGDAAALGLGFRLGTVQSAILNGSAMHVLDFEPMWNPPNHALSTTLPAILALAANLDVSGRELLTALVKGIEMQNRIRAASGHVEFDKLVFHPPGFVGPLGAAVAAGHLLRLDATELAHAIGIACSRAGGVMSNIGSMTKSTHPGYAAGLGLESAMLAARGFTANPEAFEAPQGYAQAFLPDSFDAGMMLRFGEPYRVVEPGYAIKMYPSQFATHYAITAGLSARAQIGEPGTVAAVRLVAPPLRYVDRPGPETGLEGKFSLQYTLAAALLDGEVSISTFTDARLKAADMQDMLGRISLVVSPDIPDAFGTMHMEVEVSLCGGRTVQARCDGPPGSWGQPPLGEGDHLRKIRDCLAVGLEAEDAERLIGLCGRVEHLDPGDIHSLLDLSIGSPLRGVERTCEPHDM